jgi:hypothetical protein
MGHPQVKWSVWLMTQHGGMPAQLQGDGEGVEALPLNWVECDNFCLPHGSLRQPFPQPLPTHGTGSAKQWRPCTPAMAAGLTDHVWTLREVLLFRVPPWPQAQGL